MFYVYILRSDRNDLYIGQTNKLDIREHQQLIKSSKAAKFIKDGKDFKLVYQEEYLTRLEAMRMEKQLKGWTRAKKEALIAGDLKYLKNYSFPKHSYRTLAVQENWPQKARFSFKTLKSINSG